MFIMVVGLYDVLKSVGVSEDFVCCVVEEVVNYEV